MIIQSLIMVKLLRSDGYLLKELDMPNSPLKEIMMLHFAIGLLNEYYYLFNKHKNGANRRSYSVYSFLSVYGIYAVYRSFYNKREWLLFLGCCFYVQPILLIAEKTKPRSHSMYVVHKWHSAAYSTWIIYCLSFFYSNRA